jgi:hypothetical protein
MTAIGSPIAIVVATIASYVTSYVWFTQVFATPYTRALGKTQEQLDAGPSLPAALAMQLVGTLVTVVVLSVFIQRFAAVGVLPAIWIALLAWLGFVAAVQGPIYAFQAYGLPFFLIVTGGVLAGLIVPAAILGAWR